MSENPPPPQPSSRNPEQPSSQGPEFAPPAQPPSPPAAPPLESAPFNEPTPPKKRRTGMIAVIAIITVVVVGGGIALAMNLMRGGEMNAADGLPADVILSAELNLKPAAADQLALRNIAEKFPQLEVNTETNDYKEALFSLFEDDLADDDLDYATDIEPWLGDSMAMALVNSPQFDPDTPEDSMVIVFDTTNTSKAEEFFAKTNDGADLEHFFVDDLMVIHASGLELSAEAIQQAPLSGSEEYTSMMDKLGGGLATAYLSSEALSLILESMDDADLSQLPPSFEQQVGASAVAVQVTNDMLSAKVVSTSPEAAPAMSDIRDFAGSLDGDAVFAMAVGIPADAFAEGWDEVANTPEMAEILPMLGIESADDFSALLGEELGMTIKDLNAPEPVLGLKITPTDVERHTAILENLQTQLGIPLSHEIRDGYSGIGLSPAGLESALAPEFALEDNRSYTTLTELSGTVFMVMFVNGDSVRDLAGAFGTDPAELDALGGLGLVASQVDANTSEVQLRVAFR